MYTQEVCSFIIVNARNGSLSRKRRDHAPFCNQENYCCRHLMVIPTIKSFLLRKLSLLLCKRKRMTSVLERHHVLFLPRNSSTPISPTFVLQSRFRSMQYGGVIYGLLCSPSMNIARDLRELTKR